MEPPRGYTHDQNFVMTEAKEPPSQPATPPDRERAKREEDKAAWKEQRAEEQNVVRAQEIRAEALKIATALYSVPMSEAIIAPVNVFDFADEITAYIKDGTKP